MKTHRTWLRLLLTAAKGCSEGIPSRGFTLVESLVLLFIFGVVTVTFYGVFSVGTQAILESKNRLAATGVANEKMEIVRNLEFDDIGTTGGVPAGILEEDETVATSGRSFNVHTFVQYVDDEFDGQVSGTTPVDATPNDYKRTQIEVSWGTGGASQKVILSAFFAPRGIEQAAGGGVLSVNVLNLTGSGISGATVHIVNASVSPAIDVTASTDTSGNLTLPAAPAASQTYEISISKSGYYPIQSHPNTVFVPLEPHASVVTGSVNQATLVTDQSSDLLLHTVTPAGTDEPDVNFRLFGGKQIGNTTATPSEPVYDYDENLDSGSDAQVSLGDQSPGAYTVEILDTGYAFLGLSTEEENAESFNLAPGTNPTVDVIIAPENYRSILVTVSNQSTGEMIEGANVHAESVLPGYDATATTNRYGQAYFPTDTTELTSGDYTIEVTATDFVSEDDTVTVSSSLESKQIQLTPL